MVESDCIFCKIIKGEIKTDKVDETDNFIVINDANPVAEGHCLIIPKKHYETILDVPNTLGTELVLLAKKNSIRLIKEGKADGIKLVNNNYKASGQLVPHFHMHVIPHKEGKKVGHV
jgi:histidine triad (HIT) family protein